MGEDLRVGLLALLLAGCVAGTSGDDDAAPPRQRDAALTDMGGMLCRLNSDCPPGLYCKARRCSFDCRIDRDCEGTQVCESGACVAPPDAAAPADEGSDAKVLDAGAVDAGEVPDARGPVPDAAAPPDAADPPPDMDAPDGPPDPDAAVGPLPMGDECERGADCESNICLEVAVNRQQHVICATLCCSENDCPVGFGCLYLQGARFCMPARIYPPGFDFTASRGQSCGPGGNECRSGLCDVGDDECLGACCTDQDCLGGVCRWQAAGQSNRAICDRVPIAFGRTGDGCFNELDCQSGVCALDPNPQGGAPGVCGDFCCTHGDCGGRFGCGQVIGPGGNVVSACVPLIRGQTPLGGACGVDESCQTGHCVDGLCAEPCCADLHCPLDGERCLPRFNGEGTLVRVCATPDP